MGAASLVEALHTTWFLYTTVTLIGLVVGSFLNVVIARLPKMMENAWRKECCEFLEQAPPETPHLSLSFPNSRCVHCQAPIKPWNNIPLVSFLLLGGRCPDCSCRISLRYPSVELVTALLSLGVAILMGPTLQMGCSLGLVWALIVLTGIDMDTQLLPDAITLPLLWAGLLINATGGFVSLHDAVVGAVAGYLTLWSIYWVFKLVTGKEGMGYGDFKLLAALGAWFGWQALPLIIVLSSFVGAFVGAGMMLLKGRGREVPMPFGPFLSGAGLLYLFVGAELTSLYFSTIL